MEKGRGKSDEALSSSPQGESSLDNGAVAGDKEKKEKGPHETALRLLLRTFSRGERGRGWTFPGHPASPAEVCGVPALYSRAFLTGKRNAGCPRWRQDKGRESDASPAPG